MRYVGFLAGGCVALCGASWQRRSRLLAPRLGRGSLCGNGWWVCVIFGGLCRFAQDDTVGRRGVVPNMFGSNVSDVRPPSSVASRHLPPRRGRLFRWCVALCDTSWQARSRLLAPRLGRGSLCGNGWWVCVIFGGLCRFAQDDTVGRRGVVPNMFGSNVSDVRPPSSVASRHLPPRRGRLFRWCVALCDTSWQARSRLLAPRLGRGSLCGNGWWARLIFDICAAMTKSFALR